MSNYHRITCIDCDCRTIENGMNWGGEALATVIQERSWLEQLAVLDNHFGWRLDFDVKCQGTTLDLQWFRIHKGHRLVVSCEYGTPCPHVRPAYEIIEHWDANGSPIS